MHVTDVLQRIGKKLPKGNIWRGKYKLYKTVTPIHRAIQAEEFRDEEQNMFYLRHPYLTPEQSHGHAKLFNHYHKFLEKHREVNLQWKDNKLLGDRFGFLKVSESWE